MASPAIYRHKMFIEMADHRRAATPPGDWRRQPLATQGLRAPWGRLPRLLPPVLPRLRRALEDVRGDAALLQRLAELHPPEAARRVARDAGIKAVDDLAHHGGVFVEELRQDGEIVIVDDGVDPLA